MDTRMPVDGSPILPLQFVIVYLLVFSLIYFWVYLLLRKRKSKKKGSLCFRITLTALSVNAVLFLFLFIGIIAYLFPKPAVKNTSPANSDVVYDLGSIIEVTFDHPVERKELVKILIPYTPGIFLFEDPVYATHLYRKLVFYPKFQLASNTNYQLTLTNIKNFLPWSGTNSYELSFKTQVPTGVLGAETQVFHDNNVHITDTFPKKGWIQVAADVPVKMAFNKPVNRESAETRVSFDPPINGRISWEDDTMVFVPENNFPFNTIFTVKMAPGVKGLDGTELVDEYVFYYAIQEEIFRLKVPAIYQKYTLSCETASLRMALLYRGIDVDEDNLLADVGYDPSIRNGDNWGNPYVGFVGKVKGSQMVNGYGVFWEPIARAANKYRYAKSFENWTVDQLTDSIQKGTPVIVWLALKNGRPVEWVAPSGDLINTVADEHAVLAIGFRGTRKNPSHIIINDPLVGESYWDTAIFTKKWSAFKQSGVVVF